MAKLSERPQTLKTADFRRYLNFPVFLWYYQQISQTGSTESEVDGFYANFLAVVFTARDGFGVEMGAHAANTTSVKMRPDYLLRCVTTCLPKKVVICEKSKSDEEPPPSAAWPEALQEAIKYTTASRSDTLRNEIASRAIYIAVAIGTYIRFWELPGYANEPQVWADGRTFELADDEEDLWELWHHIRELSL